MKTRRQTARAWIKKRPNGIYTSHVNCQGKLERISTGTKHRTKALDFNYLHLIKCLRNTRTPATRHHPPEQQNLFPS